MNHKIYKKDKYLYLEKEDSDKKIVSKIRINIVNLTAYDVLNKKTVSLDRRLMYDNISYHDLRNKQPIDDPFVFDVALIAKKLCDELGTGFLKLSEAEQREEKDFGFYFLYVLTHLDMFEYVQIFHRIFSTVNSIDNYAFQYIFNHRTYSSDIIPLLCYLKNPSSVNISYAIKGEFMPSYIFGERESRENIIKHLADKITLKDFQVVMRNFISLHEITARLDFRFSESVLPVMFLLYLSNKKLYETIFLDNRATFQNGIYVPELISFVGEDFIKDIESGRTVIRDRLRRIKDRMIEAKIDFSEFIKAIIYYNKVEGLEFTTAVYNLDIIQNLMRPDELASKKTFFPRYLISKLLQIRVKDITQTEEEDESALHQDTLLEGETEDYVFIVPQTVGDIVREGVNQKNCLMTYISKIKRKNSVIFFMREKNNKDKSYITCELDLHSKRIVTALAYNNDSIRDSDRAVLHKYAKLKNITVSSNV